MEALARHLPRVAARAPWVALGEWPTPLVPLVIGGRPIWVKQEGVSSARYGGNKVRTLEVWLGHAQERGARRIWAIGAYGSNHAIATVLHAPRAGLDAGVVLFPQPPSEWAIENCGALIASGCPIVRLHNVAEVPFAAMWLARRERDAIVMPPGGATPVGTLGAVSAAFELAEQIASGAAPPPKRVVVAIGSTCTTAGLLAGFSLAHAVGLWRWPVPIVHGVRVTPWPVTSRLRIAELAFRTLVRVERLGGPRVATHVPELFGRLVVDGRELGPGYGRATPAAMRAMSVIRESAIHESAIRESAIHELRLDGVYSGKAAAALLRLHRAGVEPLVFWASKSSVVLPSPSLAAVDAGPRALRDWLAAG